MPKNLRDMVMMRRQLLNLKRLAERDAGVSRERAAELIERSPQQVVGRLHMHRAGMREIMNGPRGLPLMKPPYGRITAIDLNKGEILWSVANGDGLKNHRFELLVFPTFCLYLLPPRLEHRQRVLDWMRTDDIERALPDGSRRPENGEFFHA